MARDERPTVPGQRRLQHEAKRSNIKSRKPNAGNATSGNYFKEVEPHLPKTRGLRAPSKSEAIQVLDLALS